MLSPMNILSRLNYLFKTLPIIVRGTIFDEIPGEEMTVGGREILFVWKKAGGHCLLSGKMVT